MINEQGIITVGQVASDMTSLIIYVTFYFFLAGVGLQVMDNDSALCMKAGAAKPI